MIIPPVTLNACPVQYEASSDARNRIIRATSAGSASRPSGDSSDHAATFATASWYVGKTTAEVLEQVGGLLRAG